MFTPRTIGILVWIILILMIAMFFFNKKTSVSSGSPNFGFENPLKKSTQTGN